MQAIIDTVNREAVTRRGGTREVADEPDMRIVDVETLPQIK